MLPYVMFRALIFSVSAALKKDGMSSEYFAPLQFCGVFLRDRSEVFLPPPPNQTPSTPPLSRSGDSLHEDELTQGTVSTFQLES